MDIRTLVGCFLSATPGEPSLFGILQPGVYHCGAELLVLSCPKKRELRTLGLGRASGICAGGENPPVSHALKRLHGIESDWVGFVEHARSLGSHLGPILVQLPPSFRCDVGRLKDFLAASAPLQVRLVLEFRHESWFTSQVYRLLSQHQVAHCIADSSRRRRRDVVTTDFIYLRFHGRDRSGQSVGYSDTELREEAEQLARHLEEGLDIFAYFNNDAHAHAIKNARTLKTLCTKIGIDVGGGVSVRENP